MTGAEVPSSRISPTHLKSHPLLQKNDLWQGRDWRMNADNGAAARLLVKAVVSKRHLSCYNSDLVGRGYGVPVRSSASTSLRAQIFRVDGDMAVIFWPYHSPIEYRVLVFSLRGLGIS